MSQTDGNITGKHFRFKSLVDQTDLCAHWQKMHILCRVSLEPAKKRWNYSISLLSNVSFSRVRWQLWIISTDWGWRWVNASFVKPSTVVFKQLETGVLISMACKSKGVFDWPYSGIGIIPDSGSDGWCHYSGIFQAFCYVEQNVWNIFCLFRNPNRLNWTGHSVLFQVFLFRNKVNRMHP